MRGSVFLAMASFNFLTACATFESSTARVELVDREGVHAIGAPAGHLTVVSRDPDTREVICLGRLPDSVIGTGVGASIGRGISLSDSSAELSLGGRSPAVLITREYFYRMCELMQNYRLTKEEALTLFRESYPLVLDALKNSTPGALPSATSSSSLANSAADSTQPSGSQGAATTLDPNYDTSGGAGAPTGDSSDPVPR